MLLTIAEDLPVDAPIAEVWKLLRDTPQLTGLLPGVESVRPLPETGEPGAEAYAAKATDRIGPFKVSLNLEVRIVEACEPSLLRAGIKGADAMGLTRVTGTMQISLAATSAGTQMHFEASIEVLGKLATLGAVPIRRRTTQSFAEFARNIQGRFAKEHS